MQGHRVSVTLVTPYLRPSPGSTPPRHAMTGSTGLRGGRRHERGLHCMGSSRTYRHAGPTRSTPFLHGSRHKASCTRKPLDRGHATSAHDDRSSQTPTPPEPPAVFGKLRRKTPPKTFPVLPAGLGRLAARAVSLRGVRGWGPPGGGRF